jgi:hypothetical protein
MYEVCVYVVSVCVYTHTLTTLTVYIYIQHMYTFAGRQSFISTKAVGRPGSQAHSHGTGHGTGHCMRRRQALPGPPVRMGSSYVALVPAVVR